MAWTYFTTSNVTISEMGTKLLYTITKVMNDFTGPECSVKLEIFIKQNCYFKN